MDKALGLTVLIPTLDEGAHLAKVLADVRAAAARLAPDFEILVVDGGSRDGTVAAAEAAGARVLRQRGRGYGQALREGLDAARGRWILAMDADGSHPVRYFADLWARREECDLVIASRFVAGGAARMSLYRYGLSRLLNAVTRRVADWPILDSSSGLRLYRREAAAGLPLAAEDFSVQQEALAHVLSRGGRVVEVPFLYEPRLSGESKASVALLARRYPVMLLRLRGMRGGWAGPAALAAALALGLAAGLMGITWGLPGAGRWRAFPEAMRQDPDSARRLKESWQRLYEGIEKTHREVKGEEPVTRVQGVEEIRPGWAWPPDKLVNSYRSLLVRSENPDEQKLFVMLSRMRPWRLEFQPLYLHYGGAFIYPLGVFLGAAKLLGAAVLVPDLAHYLLHPEDMARLYLLGRLFVLLFQLGALWVLYDLGRRLSGPLTGFCAATFYTLCPFFVGQSHTGKPHPYSAFWVLAAVRFLFLASDGGSRRRYLISGLCLGMAAGANSSFACLAFLPALVWLLRRKEQPRGWRHALLAMAAAVGVYVLTNPYVFIATRDYLWETTVYPGGVKDFGGNLSSLLGSWSWSGMGLGLYLLSLASLAAALLRGDPRRRMLAVVSAVGFGVLWLFLARFWGFLDAAGLRFFMPFYALACLLAADAVCSLKNRWLKTAVLLLVFMDCGLRSWVYLRNFQLDAGPSSTREQAADWIEANIPSKSTVGLPRYPQPPHTPPFRYDRYHLVIFERPDLLKPGSYPEFLVTDAVNRSSLDPLTEVHPAVIIRPGAAGASLSPLPPYRVVREFQSYHMGWAKTDAENFANAGIFILQKTNWGLKTR